MDAKMATPTSVVPGDRGRQLAELIIAESERAGLGPGGRLPTERQLALDHGVTRSAVRHALKVLEAEGRISREVGRGTFLVDGSPFDGGGGHDDGEGEPRFDDVGPADVMAVRRLMEPLVMPLVVAWATARDFEEMERCLAGGEAAQTHEDFEAWDLALHRAIFAASHSQLLVRLYAVVEAARHGYVWGDMKRRSDSRQRRDEYRQDHRELVAALRDRDVDRAVEAMRSHLARVERHLLGSADR